MTEDELEAYISEGSKSVDRVHKQGAEFLRELRTERDDLKAQVADLDRALEEGQMVWAKERRPKGVPAAPGAGGKILINVEPGGFTLGPETMKAIDRSIRRLTS